MKFKSKVAGALLIGAATGVAMFAAAGSASADTQFPAPGCSVSFSYTVNGTPAPLSAATSGDTVIAKIGVAPGCTDQVTFAAYRAPTSTSAGYQQQMLDNYQSQTLTSSGPNIAYYYLPITVPGAVAGNSAQCSQQHNNSTGGGANGPGSYGTTCNGSASGNGASTSNNSSKPCAGCVGNADNKNPPGQYPNGNDPNAGYECDRNQGVGQTNPAHTGCQHFQLDLAYGPVIQNLGPDGQYQNLIDFWNG